jgi:hypothetical protein
LVPSTAAGSRNRATLVFEDLLDKAGPRLIKLAIRTALGGDTQVLRALLPLLVPPRRERAVEFPLPPIEDAASALLASRLILAGVANATLTPAEAANLSKALTDHARLLELHELEARLTQIESERGVATIMPSVQ